MFHSIVNWLREGIEREDRKHAPHMRPGPINMGELARGAAPATSAELALQKLRYAFNPEDHFVDPTTVVESIDALIKARIVEYTRGKA